MPDIQWVVVGGVLGGKVRTVAGGIVRTGAGGMVRMVVGGGGGVAGALFGLLTTVPCPPPLPHAANPITAATIPANQTGLTISSFLAIPTTDVCTVSHPSEISTNGHRPLDAWERAE
jgi:hypothetical protein